MLGNASLCAPVSKEPDDSKSNKHRGVDDVIVSFPGFQSFVFKPRLFICILQLVAGELVLLSSRVSVV